MTTASASSVMISFPLRLVGLLINLVVGALLCLSPLTAIIVLGWQSRRIAARTDMSFGRVTDQPGWLLGPRGHGWFVRLIGGLAANIRVGLVSATGLFLLTIPFTALWLGSWWAGWENSFNKGYEQSAVGPIVWFLGAAIALPVLAHLPLALAHASAERRLGAFFEWRRIRSVVRAAGWRVVWLALLSVFFSLPFFGLRALPVFVEQIVPGFADMTLDQQLQVAGAFDLAGAALAFVLVGFLRQRAASIYCLAAPRAAHGKYAALWEGHVAQRQGPRGRTPTRIMSLVWLVLACAIWFGLPALIVFGQFMNYAPMLWLTHPVFLRPWAG